MKKFFNFIANCLSVIFFFTLVGCGNGDKSNKDTPKQEVIELTIDNWEEYLTFQKIANTTPVTTSVLYGNTFYKSTGTFTVKFYSKSNVRYENVIISISLTIYTAAYCSGSQANISLCLRTPDDWAFENEPSPTKDSAGGTHWTIIKSGTLSNDGQIAFSEPCKMNYMQPLFGYAHYDSLENAVWVSINEISGQVII